GGGGRGGGGMSSVRSAVRFGLLVAVEAVHPAVPSSAARTQADARIARRRATHRGLAIRAGGNTTPVQRSTPETGGPQIFADPGPVNPSTLQRPRSAIRARSVRSRSTGVTEIRFSSSTALQSLPGRSSWG